MYFALLRDTPGSVEVILKNTIYMRYKAEEVTLSALMLCKNGKELMRCGTDADLFKSR